MVTDKPITEEHQPPVIGPRLRAELERRVRELQGRAKPTPRELRELEGPKEFLRITPIEGYDAARRPRGVNSIGRL